jgi:hypothetical protein
MTAPVSPSATRPHPLRRVPTLKVPLGPSSPLPGTIVSLLVHTAIIVGLVWLGHDVLSGGAGGPGEQGGGGGRAGAGRTFTLFTLPALDPAPATELPPAPRVIPPPLASIPTDLAVPTFEIPREALSAPAPAATPVSTTGGGTGGTGGGTGGRDGPGTGPGSGAAQGPGTGGEGGYIFPASPRWTIVPPGSPPAGVRGQTYVVKFWVSIDGRVTRVEVDPPIRDAAYRREFMDRMKEYLFNPATSNGQRVASVFSIRISY